jgi:hypothetical protein
VYNKIVTVLGDHFDIVLQLSHLTREATIANISNCFELAVDSPALLVRSVEVMMLIEESYKKKFEKMTQLEKENLPNLMGNFEAEVVAGLRTSFDARIRNQFSNYMFNAADEGKTGIEATLGAATRGIVDMTLLKNDVAVCFPPKIEIVKIYRQQLEEYMLPQVAALYSQNIQSLDIADLLRMATWLFNYNKAVTENEAGEKAKEFEEAISNLMDEYVKQVGQQTKNWFSNIESRNSEIQVESDGCLVTRDPEDMLNIINMQVSVAREQLPAELSYAAITSCIRELRGAQERLKDDISANWKEIEIERVCTVVNDSYRLQDKCDMLLDAIPDEEMDQGREVEGLETMKEEMDSLCVGYVELAVDATKLAACSVMEDLNGPIISKVFSPAWEDGEEIMTVTVRTLKDWFTDLQKWLPEYFFSKLVRECYNQVLKNYIEAAMGGKKAKVRGGKVKREEERERANELRSFNIFPPFSHTIPHFTGLQQPCASFAAGNKRQVLSRGVFREGV